MHDTIHGIHSTERGNPIRAGKMQTFLPYPDYHKALSCLDADRLGNQVYRECLTLLNGGWKHHPASIMWRQYMYSLCDYAIAGLEILTDRGLHYPHHYTTIQNLQVSFRNRGKPYWIGDERLHSSHRAALLGKDTEYYSRFGWTETPTQSPHPYYWPPEGIRVRKPRI